MNELPEQGKMERQVGEIVAMVNTAAGSDTYARIFDGTTRKGASADIMVAGDDRVEQNISPISGYRSKLQLTIATNAESSAQSAVLVALRRHEYWVIRPLIDRVTAGADDLAIVSTSQTAIESGARTVVSIQTEIEITIELEAI